MVQRDQNRSNFTFLKKVRLLNAHACTFKSLTGCTYIYIQLIPLQLPLLLKTASTPDRPNYKNVQNT